jgi:aerobic C4-dicarboxylate transport protein
MTPPIPPSDPPPPPPPLSYETPRSLQPRRAAPPPPRVKRVYHNLTVQVLTAIVVGATLGYLQPAWGEALKPVMDGFIRLVKMVVAPIIFLTIVVGIASMGNLRKVGRVGLKALIYFEVVTTVALAIGLVVVNVVRPGEGMQGHVPPAPTAAQAAELAKASAGAKGLSTTEFLLNVIPDNVVGAFAKGDLLQILFFSVLFGVALAGLGSRNAGLMTAMEHLTEGMFRVVAIVMKVAPIGAFGAMAFTIGKYGLGSLKQLALLMACVYATMAIFIFVGLGVIAWMFKFSLWQYLVFIKEEILLVLGTSSSESALPRMIERLELLGCSRGVVGLVIPAGYSFNLDGTSIYLSMAALFVAQAQGIHLTFAQQVAMMGVLMVTSKGAAAVTGAGFVTLVATLESTHFVPVAGVAMRFGVDRFMSEARAITNLIGNGVATICVSKWEGEFDQAKYDLAVSGRALEERDLSPEVSADMARERSADVGN